MQERQVFVIENQVIQIVVAPDAEADHVLDAHTWIHCPPKDADPSSAEGQSQRCCR
ncbi:MAG: hypothetical protein JXB35_11410 [Anaerolineae bacterium]|nr:hypothetical protein [Anaerolineae bacterium]